MNMQGTKGQNYFARSGNKYTADPVSGIVLNVAVGDVENMLNSGCTPITPTGKATVLDLFSFKNSDGSILTAAASAGKFGYTVTSGTAFNLIGEVATSNTKTDACIVNYRLPESYVAGNNLTVGINCAEIGGASTLQTMLLNAYRLDEAGGEGADICATAVQNLPTTTPAILNYTITGATLSPGDIVQLKLTAVVTEAAAGTIHAVVDAVTVT